MTLTSKQNIVMGDAMFPTLENKVQKMILLLKKLKSTLTTQQT